jgi:hypothetical protein
VPWSAVAGLVAALIAIAAILTFLRLETRPGAGQGGGGGQKHPATGALARR